MRLLYGLFLLWIRIKLSCTFDDIYDNYRNKDENLASLTGGIYVSIDSDIMGSIPSGRHFYSLEIFNGNTFSDTLLRGRFELSNEDGGLLWS